MTSHGPETERAVSNFGQGSTPREVIRAYALVKEAALRAVQEVDERFSLEDFSVLMEVLAEVREGRHDALFVLDLAQGGAGTSLNMNLNEVIAQLAGLRCSRALHPLEDINRYQSTNDTFSTAVTIVAYEGLTAVEKRVVALQEVLVGLEQKYSQVLTTGRTEYQDALPMTVGQLFGAWAGPLERDRWRLSKLKERVRSIALGGTAVGTGFGAPVAYVFAAERHLRRLSGLPLSRSQNLGDEIAHLDKYSELAGGYRLVAENLVKITDDLLYLTSSAVGEIRHPNLQAGSSMMAAKTNPVLLEFVQGLAIEVQGEAYKVSLWVQSGRLQLNAFLPFILGAILKIAADLNKALDAFRRLLPLLEVREVRMRTNLGSSAALANSLVPLLGYDRVKKVLALWEASPPQNWEEAAQILQEQLALKPDELQNLLDTQSLTSYLQPQPKEKP
ncbi:MAG: fumarate lyase [Spirochaetales bacterium]|nr:fumarate lyase [Spirochaetales bacterium]